MQQDLAVQLMRSAPGGDGGVGGGARGADDVQVRLQDLLQHHVLRVLEAARAGNPLTKVSHLVDSAHAIGEGGL